MTPAVQPFTAAQIFPAPALMVGPLAWIQPAEAMPMAMVMATAGETDVAVADAVETELYLCEQRP